MKFTEEIKKYDDMITDLLKKHETVLFTDSDIPLTLEQITNPDESYKIEWKKFYSTEKYDYIHSAYLELVKHIYCDYFYQKLLSDVLNNKNESLTEIMLPYNDIDISCYQGDFYLAFELLTSLWNKYEKISTESDHLTFSWKIFEVLYSRYPILCQKAFPAVLFILADSYYDFCKLCYLYKKHQILPEQISPEQAEQILSLFYERISGKNWHYYFFSLIDTKATYYSESSFNEGQKIYNSLIKATEKIRIDPTEDPDPKSIMSAREEIEKIIDKKYMNRLKSKNDHRKEKNSSYPPITPGENLQAFWKFLYTFTENKWCSYDIAFTLYTLNHMSGWLNARLLSQYKNIDKFLFSYYLMPELPATLFYVTAHLFEYYDTANHKLGGCGQKINHKQEKISLFTRMWIHLQNTFELVDYIDDEDNFSQWYLSSSSEDLSLMKDDFKKICKNMYKELNHDSKINLNELEKLLSCYIASYFTN